MQSIRRSTALLTLIVIAIVLTACMARLLEPVVAQRSTPTPTTFETIAATMTRTITDTLAITEIDDEVTTPVVTVEETAATPTGAATPTVPVTPANTGATTTGAPTAMPVVAALTTGADAAEVAEVAATLAQNSGYDHPISPVDVIASYYDAVEQADYARAYDYWKTAPLPFDDFAAGYADTASVQVIVEPPTRIEGAAGSLYAQVPTFLIAQHTDGSVHSFAGCMTTQKSNVPAPDEADPDWYLYAAQFDVVDNFANIPAALARRVRALAAQHD